jgi:mono/diheme cytochrome c family protein
LKQLFLSLKVALKPNFNIMKKQIIMLCAGLALTLTLNQCAEKKSADSASNKEEFPTQTTASYGGFESQIKWGEHLVIIGGCNDCHTPKKMTARGPVLDTSLWLSGHPAKMPAIDVDRKAMERKGLIVTLDLTEWAGPWGVSYTANLTPDDTGLGAWSEEQFFLALREGKYKGLAGSRPLLPPMPWEMYRNMTDNEIRAVFAYLKSIKPVSNLVPPPKAPASAGN